MTDIITLNGLSEYDVLTLAASVEKYSEHPLGEAVRREALLRGSVLTEPQSFEALPGMGVRGRVNGSVITVGSSRMLMTAEAERAVAELEANGKTTLLVARDSEVIGVMGAADMLRPEIPSAIMALRAWGIREICILTGDNERVAAALAEKLGIAYHANLLPEDKIAVVNSINSRDTR